MHVPTLSLIRRTGFALLALMIAAVLLVTYPSSEPGKVHGQNTLGGPLPGLTQAQLSLFNIGKGIFETQWTPLKGLGPIYNETSCLGCHSQPVTGGANATFRATYFGTTNSDGSFNQLLNEGGYLLQPLSVAVFIQGCPVGGEVIPVDATVTSQRVPPDLFGDGLIDSIGDSTIESNSGSKGMGIDGSTNMVQDFTGKTRVGHFGDKAQFASLLQTTGHIFGHYIGITNPVDPREDCPNAVPGTPNCPTNIVPPICIKEKEPNDSGKETLQLFDFSVFLSPNNPGIGNSNGQALFTSVGCVLCHTATYTTRPAVTIPINFTGGRSNVIDALSNQPVNLYSDLLIHHMGPALADCIQLGQAQGDQWKTAPLWGLSTRTVYMHDGRTNSLTTAIQEHFAAAGTASACSNVYPDSEANQVIDNFNALSPQDQADLIAFINSL